MGGAIWPRQDWMACRAHRIHPFSSILDAWGGSLPGILTFGRQGLFAHDNTHHALYMAYCAVDCLGEGGFDHSKWAGYREIFSTHVVED